MVRLSVKRQFVQVRGRERLKTEDIRQTLKKRRTSRSEHFFANMLNKLFVTTAQVAVLLLLVILVLPSSTTANPVCKCEEQSEESSFKKVVDFNVHISEAGEKYNEKIEVDPNKKTELFQVPAHPGVDRSDVLHDFKQNLTLIRFPDSKTCYLFPLVNQQSTPEKLIQDLEKASGMVITETRRVDTTWIIEGEVSDRSLLSDELAQFCAKYSIYHVKKTLDSLIATRLQTRASTVKYSKKIGENGTRRHKEGTKRERRQSGLSGMRKLCRGGMNYVTALMNCWKPDLKCKVTDRVCYKYVICPVGGDGERPPPDPQPLPNRFSSRPQDLCWEDHIYRAIVCCEYICK